MAFKEGQSRNAAGRRAGCRKRAPELHDLITEREIILIIDKATELAHRGHAGLARLCLDRIAPAPDARAMRFGGGPLRTSDDIDVALDRTLDATLTGKITTEESIAAAKVLYLVRAALERRAIEERIAELEQ